MIRAVPLLALTGCGLSTLFEPELPPLSDEMLVVTASDVWSIPTDARFPTDVAGLRTGGFGILDGYRHRALTFDAERSFLVEVPLTNDYGKPVRAARAADGASWWFTVPEADGIVRMAVSGEILVSFALTAEDGTILGGPVAVYDTGDLLVVGLHDGTVAFADPESGVVESTWRTDADGAALGAITDIAADADGNLLVTDAFGARVIILEPTGEAITSFGHFGLWAGWLAKPKAVAPGPDGSVLVADSQLRTVQLFDPDGTFLGVVTQPDGTPIPFEHPIALEALDGGRYLALDQRTAVLWGFTLDEETVEAARDEAGAMRHLRTPLVSLDEEADLASGVLCFQCHDGTIEDARVNWDPDLGHHPIDVVPKGEIPPFFPLVDGRVMCTTCHSPHGTVSQEEAASAPERTELVRHAPSTEDELFTRVSREDSALCVACHTSAAHDKVVEEAGLGGAHLTGQALLDALAKRPGAKGEAGLPKGINGSCLTCHAVHAATKDVLKRQVSDEITCLACHDEKDVRGRNHPVGQVVADVAPVTGGLTLDPLGRNTCRTCHDIVGGSEEALLRTVAGGGLLCSACHDPIRLAGSHVNVEGTAGIPCLGCHQIHDSNTDRHLLATLHASTGSDPVGCLSCHDAKGVAAKQGVQPGQLGHPVGDAAPTCVGCHDAHRPDDPPACGDCHADQQAAADRGGHGSATCLSCHSPHTAVPMGGGKDLNPASRRCLGCHASGTDGATKIASFEHPAPVFTPGGARWTPLASLPLYTEAGHLAPAGENGDLTCGSCHEPHGPAAANPADHLRRTGWEDACAACHGDKGLLLYRYFHDPAGRARLGVTP